MSTFTYLITGASRGLGLVYTRALLESSPRTRIVAAIRNPDQATDLDKIKEEFGERVYVLKCDVVDEESTKEAASTLERSGFVEGGLDALLANAGIVSGGSKTSSQFTSEELTQVLAVNLFGVKNTIDAFLPSLRRGKGKQIFVTSSAMGSMGDPHWGASTIASAYSISKAAVNMYTVKLARELAEEGFTVVPFNPGWVKTEMGSQAADLEPKEAADLATKNIFLAVTPKDNGKFISYDGTEVAW